MIKTIGFAGVVAAAAIFITPAVAKDAQCYTTDDGDYRCQFEGIYGDGSFVISAPGYPTFTVEMAENATAWVFAVFEPGGRNVALPGPYYRSQEDGACWVNPDTDVELCAW